MLIPHLFQDAGSHSSLHKALPAVHALQDVSWKNLLHASDARKPFPRLYSQTESPHR